MVKVQRKNTYTVEDGYSSGLFKVIVVTVDRRIDDVVMDLPDKMTVDTLDLLSKRIGEISNKIRAEEQ